MKEGTAEAARAENVTSATVASLASSAMTAKGILEAARVGIGTRGTAESPTETTTNTAMAGRIAGAGGDADAGGDAGS